MATEILNDADFYKSYEIIGGEKVMAPSANLDHSGIISRLHLRFANYFLAKKSGYVFSDDVDVHFSDGTLFKPDLVVVLKSNEKILASRKAIYGAPDMVVEVLSNSTRKKDLTIKKDVYEAQGVALRFIFFATANIFLTTNIFFSTRKMLKKTSGSKAKARKLKLSMKFLLRFLTG